MIGVISAVPLLVSSALPFGGSDGNGDFIGDVRCAEAFEQKTCLIVDSQTTLSVTDKATLSDVYQKQLSALADQKKKKGYELGMEIIIHGDEQYYSEVMASMNDIYQGKRHPRLTLSNDKGDAQNSGKVTLLTGIVNRS